MPCGRGGEAKVKWKFPPRRKCPIRKSKVSDKIKRKLFFYYFPLIISNNKEWTVEHRLSILKAPDSVLEIAKKSGRIPA